MGTRGSVFARKTETEASLLCPTTAALAGKLSLYLGKEDERK